MEALLIALALLAAPPAPCANPDCYCTVCECDACPCGLFEVSERSPATGKRSLQVAEEPIRILRFTADWCGPCKSMAPAWSRVAAENPGLLSELDFDANRSLARQWGVTAIPAVVVVRDGKLLTRYRAGAMSESQIRAIVRQWSDQK